MFDRVLNTSMHPSSQELLYTFMEGRFERKTLGELTNKFLQMFGETLPHNCFYQKTSFCNLLEKE